MQYRVLRVFPGLLAYLYAACWPSPPGGPCRHDFRRRARGSSVGISARNQSTMKMATPDVDHGSATATRTASKWTFKGRAAESRHAPKAAGPGLDALPLVSSVTDDSHA